MNQQVPDDLISAYFDGEVTQDERRQVEQLLESSAESRQLLEDAAKLSAMLHSFPRAAAPADLARNVQQQIESAILITPAPAPIKRPGLRREWTIFAGGVLATVVPLMLFVVLKPTDLGNKTASVALHHAGGEGGLGGHGPQDIARADNVPRQKLAFKLHEMLPEAPGAAKPVGGVMPVAMPQPTDMVANESVDVSVNQPTVLDERLQTAATAATDSLPFFKVADGAVTDFTDDGIPLMPDDQEHFIQSLKKGEIAVRSVANTNDAVAVVELIVVDINRGADEMEMLLLRVLRNVDQNTEKAASVNSSESTRQFFAKDDSLKDSLARSKSSDEMAMLYVRAPGDQLSQALAEAVKRPEIYLAVSPKVPMTFPGEQIASQATVNQDVDAKATVASQNTDKPVSVEAGLVVNSFLSMNGIEAKAKDGQVNIKQNGLAHEYSFHAHPTAEATPSAQVAISETQTADGTGGENQQPGFTSLRVVVDKEALAKEQKREPKPNLASRKLLQNGNLPKGASQEAAAVQLQKPEQNHRDPQLVRMLIVLKSGQTASPP